MEVDPTNVQQGTKFNGNVTVTGDFNIAGEFKFSDDLQVEGCVKTNCINDLNDPFNQITSSSNILLTPEKSPGNFENPIRNFELVNRNLAICDAEGNGPVNYPSDTTDPRWGYNYMLVHGGSDFRDIVRIRKSQNYNSIYNQYGAALQITAPQQGIGEDVTIQLGRDFVSQNNAGIIAFKYQGNGSPLNSIRIDTNGNQASSTPSFVITMPPPPQLGNVGIHVDQPQYPLDIQGDTAIRNISTGNIIMYVDAANGDFTLNASDTTRMMYLDGNSTSFNIGKGAGTTQSTDCIAIGFNAGQSQGLNSIAFGSNAGKTNQGQDCIAIGTNAGFTGQGQSATAIGTRAGHSNQGGSSFAIGTTAGETNQGIRCIAFGNEAGRQNQGQDSIAIGFNSGRSSQGIQTVAIGQNAGEASQATSGGNSVAVGFYAGNVNQSTNCVAVGKSAGQTNQSSNAVAVGANAGAGSQKASATAVGFQSGYSNQNFAAVAVGSASGNINQGTGAIAVGTSAGEQTQGDYAIALGFLAGQTSQHSNSIILNSSGVALNSTAQNQFIVSNMRNDQLTATNSMTYNPTTKEITYETVSNQHPVMSLLSYDYTILYPDQTWYGVTYTSIYHGDFSTSTTGTNIFTNTRLGLKHEVGNFTNISGKTLAVQVNANIALNKNALTGERHVRVALYNSTGVFQGTIGEFTIAISAPAPSLDFVGGTSACFSLQPGYIFQIQFWQNQGSAIYIEYSKVQINVL
jgi:hypothetical protein